MKNRIRNYSDFDSDDYSEYNDVNFQKRKSKPVDPYKRVDPKREKKDTYDAQRKLKRGEHDE